MLRRGILLVAATGAWACAGGASAAEWTKSAGIAVGSYYSTNICQSPEDEESKTVGTVTPSINLRADAPRAEMNLSAAVEYNTLGESSLECPQIGGAFDPSNRETWVPRIDFTGEIEAIENAFYFEADANAAQNAINPFAPGGDDNINATGNTNITYRWGVGARLDRQHNDQWASLIRYNYNEQYNSFNQALGDSQEDRVELDIGMIPGASRFSAGLSGTYSEVTFDETAVQPEFTNRLSRLQLRAALQLSRQWQLNGYVGEEDNVFTSANDEIDGDFWDAGIRWTPNTRVTVDAGYGERFFGDAPRFSVDYRHKRQFLKASYIRDLQFPRDIRGAGNSDPDDPLAPGPGLPGEPLPGGGSPTFLGQSPVLNENFTLSYRFVARRTSFSVSANDSKQTFASNGGEGEFRSVSLSATRRLGPALTADATASWNRNEGGLGAIGAPTLDQGLEARRFALGLQRRLARQTILSVRYSYTDQESTFLNQGGRQGTFDEHRVDLGLRFNFGGN